MLWHWNLLTSLFHLTVQERTILVHFLTCRSDFNTLDLQLHKNCCDIVALWCLSCISYALMLSNFACDVVFTRKWHCRPKIISVSNTIPGIFKKLYDPLKFKTCRRPGRDVRSLCGNSDCWRITLILLPMITDNNKASGIQPTGVFRSLQVGQGVGSSLSKIKMSKFNHVYPLYAWLLNFNLSNSYLLTSQWSMANWVSEFRNLWTDCHKILMSVDSSISPNTIK